jgi:hypothetical protein
MPLPLLEPVSEGAPTFLGAPRGSLESLTTPFGAMGVRTGAGGAATLRSSQR